MADANKRQKKHILQLTKYSSTKKTDETQKYVYSKYSNGTFFYYIFTRPQLKFLTTAKLC